MALLGGRFDDVEGGFAIAPTDVALWAPRPTAAARKRRLRRGDRARPGAEAPMALVERGRACAGRGLEGDRYFDGQRHLLELVLRGHDLTLIEAEVVDDARPPA